MAELRLYNTEDTTYFPLIDFEDTDFEKTPVIFEAGDSQISKDGGSFTNTTNLPSYVGNGLYSITLSESEHTCKKAIITIIDQTPLALWEDQAINIETCGHANSQHPGIGVYTALINTTITNAHENISSNLATQYSLVKFLSDIESGDWVLQEPNDLIYYLQGTVTIIAQWKCFNMLGQPSVTNIAKIERV